MAIFHCKSCGKESRASLCDRCFLDEMIDAVDRGEEDPSKILQDLVRKYGRLKGLRDLRVFKELFGPKRLKRTIRTEEGVRCRLVPTQDGWVAVAPVGEKRIGRPATYEEMEEYPTARSASIVPPGETITTLPGESTEGGRVITYYEGDVPVHETHSSTALVFPKYKVRKSRRSESTAPPPDYRSPRYS